MRPSALRPVRAVAAVVAVALALGGCGADDDAEPTIPTVDFSPAAVISVSPAGLVCALEAAEAGAAGEDCEVGAGSVVEVRNEGPDVARVRGGDVFDSGTMEPGDTMTVVLVDPGELQLETVGPPDATLTVTVTPRAG